MGRAVVSESFARIARRLRLRAITFHGLRHTHATLGLSAGIHPKVMQERLGHSSIAVTMDTYSHAIPAMQADAAAKIAALLGWRGGRRPGICEHSVSNQARQT